MKRTKQIERSEYFFARLHSGPSWGSSGRVSTAKRNPGETPTAGRGQGTACPVSRPNIGLGSFVATSWQKLWPSAGCFVAAYGHFFMAADKLLTRIGFAHKGPPFAERT